MDEVEIFAQASKIDDPGQRRAFLDRACSGNVELKQRLAAFLRSAEVAGSFMESPAPVQAIAANPDQTMASQDGQPVAADNLETYVLGDFRILQEIGRGGMGVVYEAEQISLGRRVALKVLPYASMLDKNQLTRFQNEARAAASLEHPNVVRVHSVGTERGVHYFAMQLIRGQSLDEMIKAERKKRGIWDHKVVESPKQSSGYEPTSAYLVSAAVASKENDLIDTVTDAVPAVATRHDVDDQIWIRAVVELAIQAAEALEHAHRMGIVHRDIKPSNLLIDADQHLWVADFGLALIEADANLTTSGSMIGTLRYMSPEQMRGDRHVLDHHTDVYSLGTTLYEMLTLRPAFPDSDATRLMQRISHDEPVSPRKFNFAIPRDLETVVLKAMAKDLDDRYPTAGDMAADLRRVLDHEPIHAKPPSTIDRAQKWARRHRAVVSTAGATLLFAIAVAGGLLWNERRDTLAALNRETAQRQLADARLRELQVSRQDADTNYQVALQTVDAMLLGLVDDQVARVPVSSRNGLLADAERLFDQLLQYNASDTEAVLQRARVHASLLEPAKALADYENLLRLDPDHARGHADLAKFLGHNLDVHYRRHDQALQHARRAFELEPDNVEFRVILAFLNREDDPQQALSLLDRAIELDSRSAEAYMRRGMVRWDVGHREGALSDIERALQLNPEYAAAVRYRAEMLAESGCDPEALDEFAKAIILDPYNPKAYVGRAGVRWRLGDTQLALQDLDAAKNLAPAYPVSYQESAQLRTLTGQFREALEDITRQIAAQPDSPWLRRKRGDVYMRLQEYQEAQADFDFFLARLPDEWYVYKRRAVARFNLGQVDAALNDLEKAVEVNPNDPSTVRWIAPRRFLQVATPKQRERLLQLADKTIELNPQGQFGAWALADRATIYFAWGEQQKAVADCAEAVKQDPRVALAWYLHAVSELMQPNQDAYREICQTMLPQLDALDGTGAWPDCAAWTYALAPDALPDLSGVISHAERFLKYSLAQDRWWSADGRADVGNVWLRQQILGSLLYRAGRTSEALPLLRISHLQYDHMSGWPPYSRFFLAMLYADRGNPEEAQRWLTLAVNWSDEAMKDDSRFPWHHRATLKMLRGETEAVVAKAVAAAGMP